MQVPPPLPKKKAPKWPWILVATAVVVAAIAIAGGITVYRTVIRSGVTGTLDNKFGDQHLKTAVALIELHKVRFGKYPDSLRDLKFTGDWDQLALQSVRYYPSPNRDAYYVEVERGWMGKPTLTMPPEFWKGTGYSPTLKPASP